MSTDLEDRIRRWVDGEVAGVAPVTVDEVLTLTPPASSRLQPGDRRHRLVPSVAAAVVLVVGALAFAVLAGDDEGPAVLTVSSTPEPEAGTGPESTSVEDPAGEQWETFVEPTFGWTWEQPEAWTSQSQRDYCNTDGPGVTSTLVTNAGHRISHPLADPIALHERGCDEADLEWSMPTPRPAGFVGVEIRSIQFLSTPYAPAAGRSGSMAFPLDLDDFETGSTSSVSASGPDRRAHVVHRGESYEVLVYEGEVPTVQARRELDRLIASIRPTDLPAAAPVEFAWLPEGAEQLAGFHEPGSSSQSAHVHFPDEAGSSIPGRNVIVRINTLNTTLQVTRMEMDAERSDSVAKYLELQQAMEAELGSATTGEATRPPVRERVEVRGAQAVLDRWWYGAQETTRITFFEYDNLAVEVTCHGIPDDELYRVIEGLRLVAVGGPAG